MGNAFSEEEHKGEFLEDGFNLEDPNANDKINYGAAAPRCQPKHTEAELVTKKEPEAEQGEEVELSGHKHDLERQNSAASGGDHRGKRPHTNTAQQQQQEQAEEEPKQLSYIQMAKMGYQELVNAIIRPPRAEYKVQYRNETSRGPDEIVHVSYISLESFSFFQMEALGPPAFNFCGKRFTRTDFTLRTKRGYNLECSHWEPVERATDRIPVVIYMHGNSSARVEVIPQLSYLLSLGVAVFAFDFAGSGKSDGEYVSLGYYEREDLSCIVAHLRATNVVSTIALWYVLEWLQAKSCLILATNERPVSHSL